nr:MAG TPA: hypothetical protein [Caudoviricetes sp.]
MTTYTIYTTGSKDPFTFNVDYDLISTYKDSAYLTKPTLTVEYMKDHLGMGVYKHTVILNMNNIVSISKAEKEVK